MAFCFCYFLSKCQDFSVARKFLNQTSFENMSAASTIKCIRGQWKEGARAPCQTGGITVSLCGWLMPNGGSKSETIEPYPALGTVKIEKIEFLRANFKIPHPRNKQEQRVPSVSGVLPAIFNGPFGSPDLPKASRHFMAMAMRHFCS